jgi:DNA-binding LytR/AlgR family response regulator
VLQEKIRNFFKKELYLPDAKKRWGIIVFITLWVLLILSALQPFGLNYAKHKLLITLGTTLAVFLLCVIFIQGLLFLFENYYSAANWNNGVFFGICGGVLIAFALLEAFVLSPYVDVLDGPIYYGDFTSLQRFFAYFRASVFVAIFPIAAIYYYILSKSLKRQTAGQEMDEDSPDSINLSGNTKEHIKLYPANMLYAKVSGNYVAVYYVKNNKVEYKFLRMSLNQLSNSLQDYPCIVRCHRAFLVNTLSVVKVRGSSKGYRLELKNTDMAIPVSKSHVKIFNEKMSGESYY